MAPRWSWSLRIARQVNNLTQRAQKLQYSTIIESNDKDPRFVDFRKVDVQGGHGGRGCVSFYHITYKRKRVPDGGDGGKGGDIIFKADSKLSTLSGVRPHLRGLPGGGGASQNMLGRNAKPTIIPLPTGTMIFEDDKLVADLCHHGQEYLAASGGSAGRGNSGGSKSTRALQPHDERARGSPGQERRLILDLRTVADVGLVGMPNAGKSTFLNAVSNAHPRIASYPFTTLNPHLGAVDFDDFFRMRVADIPGIIRDSSTDVGVGYRFLKHLERNKVLLYILDMSEHATLRPWQAFDLLQGELERYRPGMTERRSLVVANKMDCPGSDKNLESLDKKLPDAYEIVPVIAQRAHNVKAVTALLRRLVEG